MSTQKQQYALGQNIQKFIQYTGENRVGLLTLTFKDNVTDHKEAYRRFCNMARRFLREEFGCYIGTKERQKRGALHYHLVIDCKEDIVGRGEWVFVPEKKRWYFKSPPPSLVRLRRLLREKLGVYGFGAIHNLNPIRTNAEAVGKYIAKYIGKNLENRKPEDKGVQLVMYSQGVNRSISGSFGWVGKRSTETRRQVQYYAARLHDCSSMEELRDKLGQRWALSFYKLLPYLNEILPVPWGNENEEKEVFETQPLAETENLEPVGFPRAMAFSFERWHEAYQQAKSLQLDKIQDDETGRSVGIEKSPHVKSHSELLTLPFHSPGTTAVAKDPGQSYARTGEQGVESLACLVLHLRKEKL